MASPATIVEPLEPVPDPWVIAQNLSHHGVPKLLFLDSALRHDLRGRYSYIAGAPTRWFEGSIDNYRDGDPFAKLAKQIEPLRRDTLYGLPPFQGGLAGLFGYELAHCTENLPRLPLLASKIPDLAVGLYLWVLAWDHLKGEAWLIVHPDGPSPKQIQEWMKPAKALRVGETNSTTFPPEPFQHAVFDSIVGNFSKIGFTEAVRRAIEFIHAGDCFQVNIAQTLCKRANLNSLELYGRLRERNPAPFAAYFDMGQHVLLSASPERFLKVSNREVETRPIKGTRPRGRTPAEDVKAQLDLYDSEKDRAENIMIVDLLRNDLGKVCEFGSIRVPIVCEIETFETVHHMVSEVRGRLRHNQSGLDLLRACFPGGSVTGAPKVRAMQIISELEGLRRGPYCGSLGFIGLDGAMDSNLLIRTIAAAKGWWTFPVGGGIVADSDPEREYEETLHKAAGLVKAFV